MRRAALALLPLLVLASVPAAAATIHFGTDPFAGTTALTTPGRQIIGGELFTPFDPAADQFTFNPARFGVTDLHFINSDAAGIPASGVNLIVLEEFGPPMAAGAAADLIAAAITTPGPGFLVYFNTGLTFPRLVFSTDLSDETADLKVLARLTNLGGNPAALATFEADNFALVPEPSSVLLLAAGIAGLAARRRRA